MVRFNIWPRHEKYLLVEILPSGVSGLLLSLNTEKRLHVNKFFKNLVPSKSPKAPHVILSLDSSLAFTSYIPVHIVREEITPISELELEHLVAQSVTKRIRHYLGEAAEKLGVDEDGIVLAGSKIVNFKIDGHRVIDPVGFPAREIGAMLELTFITKPLAREIKPFFEHGPSALVTEIVKATLHGAQKTTDSIPNLLLVRGNQSDFIALRPGVFRETVLRGSIPWGTDYCHEILRRAFGVSAGVAEILYRSYLSKDLSQVAARYFERVLRPVVQNFLSEVRKSGIEGGLYLDYTVPLPMPLPYRIGKIELRSLPLRELLKKTGLTIAMFEWPMPEHRIFPKIAPFMEFYFGERDSYINQKLRRHLNWLMPSVTID